VTALLECDTPADEIRGTLRPGEESWRRSEWRSASAAAMAGQEVVTDPRYSSWDESFSDPPAWPHRRLFRSAARSRHRRAYTTHVPV
jgi:hypothetical protein